FEVEKIRLRLDKLIFEGHRSHLVYDKDSDDFFNVPQYDKVKIEIELDPAHASEADLADLISKVFVTKQDELEDTVPEPWKTILREQLKANTMLGGQVYKAGP